jgi:uncharacterized protein HemX
MGKGLYIVGFFALAVAFLAASASGVLWWQYRQLHVALDQADSDSAVFIQDVRASILSLTDSIGDSVEALQESDELALDVARGMNRRLEELPERLRLLEERVNAVQGTSADAKRRWLRAEAEYYLSAANTELTLGGRWQNAIDALEFADGKLLELGSPSFSGVRQLIYEELQALRGVQLPDIEGLSYSLARLADGVESLPLGAVVPTNPITDEEMLESAEPGLDRIWLSLKQAIAGMISVERGDGSLYRVLAVEEQVLVRRRLELELEMARLGLLQGQAEVFQVSLNAARALLIREFERSNPAVESATMLIEELLRLEVDPARPDISGSLNLLRSLPDGEG